MKLDKRYSFLFIPEGDGQTREFRVPGWVFVAATGCAVLFVLVAGLYVVDWSVGAAWRPGGAPIAAENDQLRREITSFETRVASMQGDLDRVFEFQQIVAAAVDVEPLDAQTRAGGVGGRGPLKVTDEWMQTSLLGEGAIVRNALNWMDCNLTTVQLLPVPRA